MAKLQIAKGTVDKTVQVFVRDSTATNGDGLTGLVYNSAGLSCYFCRPGSVPAKLTLSSQTVTGAHSNGGFVELDATNTPGMYRLDLADSMIASGVDDMVVYLHGASNMAPVKLEIQLTNFDLNDASPEVTLANETHTGAVIPTVTTLAGHTAQTGDSYARIGAPAGASIAADLVEIEGQTDDIGVAGAGLANVPWNASWDVEVQSEVNDALVALHLDHLLAVDYDPALPPGVATALLNELVESDGGVSRFTTNALEQVWQAAVRILTASTNFNDLSAAEVNAEVDTALADYDGPTKAEMDARTLDTATYFDPATDTVALVTDVTTKTGYSLSTAGILAIWHQLTSAIVTASTIGKLIVDYLDAAISSRSSHSAGDVTTDMDSNSTQLTAIVGDTNELQGDWVDGGRLDLILDARASQATADAIELDTQDLQTQVGTAGAGLTDLGGMSAGMKAETNAEADTALSDYDPPTRLEATADKDEILAALPATPVSGTADSGTSLTMVDAARAEADSDYWKDGFIRFTSGTISGQVRLITGFTPGTDTVTFAPATTQAVGTNTYEILPAALIAGIGGTKNTFDDLNDVSTAQVNTEADTALADYDGPTDTEMIARTLPTANYFDPATDTVALVTDVTTKTGYSLSTAGILAIWHQLVSAVVTASTMGKLIVDFLDTAVSGRASQATADAIETDTQDIQTQVGPLGAGLTDLGGMSTSMKAQINTEADTAISDAALATAAALAVVDGIVDDILVDTGTTMPALIAALNNISTAQVNAEMVDALNVDTYGEPTGVPSATASIVDKLGRLHMALRNEIRITSTKKTFYDDGGSPEWEKDLSDDGSTYVETKASAI